jgi:hypothetical protein
MAERVTPLDQRCGFQGVTVLVIRQGTPNIRIFVENRSPATSFAGAAMFSRTVPEPSRSWCRRGSATSANSSAAAAATATDRLTRRGPASTRETVRLGTSFGDAAVTISRPRFHSLSARANIVSAVKHLNPPARYNLPS